MLTVILICAATCLTMILCILFHPKFTFGKVCADAYWVIALAGAAVVLLCGQIQPGDVWSSMTADTAINPLKILVLFLSMSVLSIFLDELGFFRYLANAVLSKARTSQRKLFLYLYVTVSVLTVFTSNDIIILSFTPFICYFAKRANIRPLPYLAAEFIAANTWSMALIIGNPTNIYLATSYNIGFAAYLRVMLLPTVGSGVAAFLALLLVYRKSLAAPMEPHPEPVVIQDRLLLIVGLIHLAVCTVFLAIGSYIGVEMWLVALLSVCSLFLWVLAVSALRREPPTAFLHCLKRAPWSLVPFVLSMFVLILTLSGKGVTAVLAELLGRAPVVAGYGIASFLSANILNNIPMSVLFCSVCQHLTGAQQQMAVYASVIGSNLGAFLTPIGALAGIMWSNLLRRFGIRFEYRDFLKMGLTVAVPTLAVALLLLGI